MTELKEYSATAVPDEDGYLLAETPREKVFDAAQDDSELASATLSRATSKRTRARTRKQFFKEMFYQTVPMILLSLVSSVFTGELIAHLKSWPIFLRVPELFILVPILLNLKGNLEMNLAARFSTSANIGELDIRLTRRTLIMGNLALLQVQALLVSMLAGVIAFSLGLATRVAPLPDEVIPDQFKQDRGTYFECVMVLAASMLAASVSSALVGSFMCALVVLSRKFSINPDNIATPLAASLGDLVALALLGVVSSALGHYEDTILSTGIMVALLFCVAFNVWLTMRNAYVQELLWSGWGPLLLAMIISSGTGLVLQRYVNAFKGYGLIAPVVTAVIGNVGAILVSRISTSLHSTTYATAPHMLTAVSLFIISAPVLGLFILFAVFSGQVDFSFVFTVLYTITCAFGVALSLCIGWALAVGLWNANFDPDINALPLLSSAMDVVGQVLLALAFSLSGMAKPAPLASEVLASGNSTSTIASATATLVGRHPLPTFRRVRKRHS